MYYAYARVSTKYQKSIEVQLQFLRRDAENIGFKESEIIELYDKDSGAKFEERKSFIYLIEIVKQGDIIGIYSDDRWGRDTEQNVKYFKIICEKGAKLRSGGREISANVASDEFYFSMASAMATFQRQSILNKSKASMDNNRTKGKFLYTGDLFGYRRTKNKNKPIEIYEPEAKWLRYIFEETKKGRSPYDLANELEKIIIEGSTHTLNVWFIRRCLYKPIYMGKYTLKPWLELGWQQYQGTINSTTPITRAQLENVLVDSIYYPPIIEPDDWWYVFDHARRVTRKHAKQYEIRETPYCCTGIYRCPVCANGFVHSFVKKDPYHYEVYQIAKHKKDCTQKQYVTLRKELAEYIVEMCFFFTFTDGTHIGKMFDDRMLGLNMSKDVIENQIKLKEEELAKLKKRISKIGDAILDCEDNDSLKESYEEKADEANKKKKKIEAEINDFKLQRRQVELDIEYLLEEHGNDVMEKFIHETEEGRRNILIDSCTAFADRKKIKVHFRNGMNFEFDNHTLYCHHTQSKPYNFTMTYEEEEILKGSVVVPENDIKIVQLRANDDFSKSVNRINNEWAEKVMKLMDETKENTVELPRNTYELTNSPD